MANKEVSCGMRACGRFHALEKTTILPIGEEGQSAYICPDCVAEARAYLETIKRPNERRRITNDR